MIVIGMINLIIYSSVLTFIIRTIQKSLKTKSINFDNPLWFSILIALLFSVKGILINGTDGNYRLIYENFVLAGLTLFVGFILQKLFTH